MGNSYTPAPLPDFFDDPMFQSTQKSLLGYGTGIMEGNLPDFYKTLGQSNSPEFQSMLRRSNAKIAGATLEAGARTGTRGGAIASATAKAVGENTGNLQWADYMNMINQKSSLLTTGLNTVGGVRSGAFDFMGLKNNFNLSRAQLDESQRKMQSKLAEDAKARKSAAWSQIISSGLSAAGTIGGFMIGGPPGAMVGGALGSAAGSAVGPGASPSSGAWSGMDFSNFG